MTNRDIEKIAEETIAALPEYFRGKMDNVVIIVQDKPTPSQIRRMGRTLLGLYEGIPLSERGTGYSGALPDKITLFRHNLESDCEDEEELSRLVAHTVLHELAHHFGISDEELLRSGNY